MIASLPGRSSLTMRWLLFGVLALGVLGLSAGRGTLAYFTSSATSSGNTFRTGLVDIKVASGSDCSTSTYAQTLASAFINQTLAKPGTVTTQPLCLQNDNTTGQALQFQWALSSTVTDDTNTNAALKSLVKLRAWTVTSATQACAAGFNADGTDTVLGTVQTSFGTELLPSQTLATNPAISKSSSTQLNAGSTQRLCFSAVLPDTVSDSDAAAAGTVQNKTVTAGFTFQADNT